MICPGAIESEISDSKPGAADEVARLVVFLASDASRYILGMEIWIDGAESSLIG